MSDIIQVDYDGLNKIVGNFEYQAQFVQDITQKIADQVEVLKNGTWIGVGADAFYVEMDQICFPNLQRLQQALLHSASAIQDMIKIMGEAEEIAEQQVNLSGSTGDTTGIKTPSTTEHLAKPSKSQGAVDITNHQVIRGDTLWDIGQRYGVSVDQLMEANPHITNRDLIYPGQEILIPTDDNLTDKAPSNPPPASKAPSNAGGMGNVAYNQMIDNLNVANNSRYARRNGETFCNLFVYDMAVNYGATLPLYVTDGKGNTNDHITRWLDANLMKDWLDNRLNVPGVYTQGGANGWVKVDANTAAQAANNGQLAIVAGAGHMAVVRSGNSPHIKSPNDVLIAQAGARNFNQGRMVDGWGQYANQAEFYVYQK